MPFIRHVSAQQNASPSDGEPGPVELLIHDLAHEEMNQRYRAIRALRGVAAALEPMAKLGGTEGDGALRAAIFESIAAIGSTNAALKLAWFLRSETALVRGAAIAALQLMGESACAVVDGILNDPDADLRLLGVEVMRAWRPELAMPRLTRIMSEDMQVNVCAAALDVAAQTGTMMLLPALDRLRIRFGGVGFILFAEEQTRLRIQARKR